MPKKILLRIIVVIICVISTWSAIVTTDYFRAKAQTDPLFSIQQAHAMDGGTIAYYGLGYTIIHYNQLPGNGGRTDIVFKFELSSSLADYIVNACTVYFLLYILPIIIAVLLNAHIPKFLFFAPAASIVVIFVFGFIIYGYESADFSNIQGWIQVMFTFVYSIIVTILVHVYPKIKKCFKKLKLHGV